MLADKETRETGTLNMQTIPFVEETCYPFSSWKAGNDVAKSLVTSALTIRPMLYLAPPDAYIYLVLPRPLSYRIVSQLTNGIHLYGRGHMFFTKSFNVIIS